MGVARRIETPAQAIKRLEREIESLKGLAVATRGDFLSYFREPLAVAEVTTGTEATLQLVVPEEARGQALRIVGTFQGNAGTGSGAELVIGFDGITGTNFYRQERAFLIGGAGVSATERTSNFAIGPVVPNSADESGSVDFFIGPQAGNRIPCHWQAGVIPGTNTANYRTVIGTGRAAGTEFTTITITAGSNASFTVGTRFELRYA